MQTPGRLYIVATPIGNLDDITLRALHILKTVDVIAVEDTRHSGKLLQHFDISTPMISLHDYNEKQRTAFILKKLQAGENVALISDAGTPLISDPGYILVKAAQEAGLKVSPIPGACAAIAALSASGLPSDQFLFLGFLPHKTVARQKKLQELLHESRTVIFYEAPHRILELLEDMIVILGENRQAVLAKELTKTFETLYSGSLLDIGNWLKSNSQHQKGEFVILVRGVDLISDAQLNAQAEKVLKILLKELPSKQAIKLAVEITGLKKNLLYKKAMLEEGKGSGHLEKGSGLDI